MCGLIYCNNFNGKPVNGFIMKQFEDQKTRGMEGFGLYDEDRSCLHRSTKLKKTLSYLKNRPSSSILFHHRWPTSTENVKNACHPFGTRDFFKTSYVLAHNGVVSNSRELKVEHEKLGIVYSSVQKDGRFNDSEALLWDVALYLEGKQTELKAAGSIAFICIARPTDKRKHTKLYFARNTSPLNMQYRPSHLMLSSEGPGEPIDADTLYSYDYRAFKLEAQSLTVPRYPVYDWGDETVYSKQYNFNQTLGVGTGSDWPDSGMPYSERYEDDELAIMEQLALEDDDITTNHFLVLPNDIDVSYATIFPEIKNEVVYQADSGQRYHVKDTIATRLDAYFEAVDGHYKQAYALIKADVELFQSQLINDIEDGLVDDEDLFLEVDILRAALQCLDTSPHWLSDRSIEPGYASLVTDAVRTLLTANKATLNSH